MIQIANITLKVFVFIWMILLMKYNTNYEYLKHKKNLIIYFALDVSTYFLSVFVYSIITLYNIPKFDSTYKNQDVKYICINFILMGFYMLNIHQVFVGYCIIYCKGS